MVSHFPGICRRLSFVVETLRPGSFLRLLASRLFSKNHYYLLEMDLCTGSYPTRRPDSRIQLKLMEEDDLAEIRRSLCSLDEQDKREVLARIFFYWDGFRNCYVAKAGGEITAIAWILYPEESQRLQKKYPSKFHPLESSQVMIENVFTFPRFRRMGFMRSAVEALLDVARGRNFSSAVCYIRKDRLDSLNAFISMGFRLVKIMPEYKFLGHESRML